jgi:hypothetical protein
MADLHKAKVSEVTISVSFEIPETNVTNAQYENLDELVRMVIMRAVEGTLIHALELERCFDCETDVQYWSEGDN